MKGKHEAQTLKHTAVILSEVKDLWFCSGFQNERLEMFRFAQHDNKMCAMWYEGSSFSGCWKLEDW